MKFTALIFICLSLPSWAEEVMKPGSDFQYLALFYFTIFSHTKEMKKFRSGYLLKEILDRSTNKTMSTLSPNRSLWLYFAHDNSMADMLNSLGLFDVSIEKLFSISNYFHLLNFMCFSATRATIYIVPVLRIV